MGFATEANEVSEGYSSVGAPVLNHLGFPLAGIAITFQTLIVSQLQLNQLGETLKVFAAELSRKLGHHG
jgi:DNA-binding IclR family transcriptional regulator